MTLAPFAAGSLNPLMDGVLVSLLLVHSHIGFDSIITDYAPSWRVPMSRKLLNWARNLALVLVGWGWYEFETNDVGLTEGVKRLWHA
ncbi:membrane anchor subunit of succinate dehydrogenase, Sdh4 [Vermiconidia calcicola]|uniref:Membrane anchor subunit of succinate dehydrogenase, Sdh4 n=1 Tax=Vermiconidia calcicola TaxID=1690605 RepID=A0ACC3NUA1_9PEZI|nr:membrane anchor subunit of succinate dehydrogenase, Sdh4 [Vermiconidia calcicola]